MIKIEIGKPKLAVCVSMKDKDGETEAKDWAKLTLALKKKLSKIDDCFKDTVHCVEFLVKNRGCFTLEGSKKEIEVAIQDIKEIAQEQNIELEIGD